MGRHEAQARDGRPAIGGSQRVDGPDQLGEVRPSVQVDAAARPALGIDVREARFRRQVMAVRVDVLPEERDLAIARNGQASGFLHDVVERPAPLGPRG